MMTKSKIEIFIILPVFLFITYFFAFGEGKKSLRKEKLFIINKIEVGEEQWFQISNELPAMPIESGENEKKRRITEIKIMEIKAKE